MGPIAYNYVAYIYYGLGDMDKYFEYMSRALEAHALISTWVMYSPILEKTKQDPRYKERVKDFRTQAGLASPV